MRLIDADVLFRLIKEQKVKETGAYSKGINNGLNIAMSILKDVNQTPTSYDIDKVVEEIGEMLNYEKERNRCLSTKCDLGDDCTDCVLKLAIEIVKAGGKNER